MNATPPEANSEYSRGLPTSRQLSDRDSVVPGPRAAVLGSVLCGGLLGAVLLVVAEFTTLYQVRAAPTSTVVRTVGTGSHNSYALIPLALLAVLLALAVWSAASRPALVALGVLGVIALLIGLIGDLPDAHANGLLGSSTTRFVLAQSRPSAGFYMETLGAIVLLISAVSGFLLLGGPVRTGGRRGAAGRPTQA